jgi:hypothetical protein
MISSYKPYPIYDFKTGLKLDAEQWRLPSDALDIMQNCYVYQGTVNKRLGYTEFDKLVHLVSDEVLSSTADGSITSFNGTLSNTPVRVSDILFTATLTNSGTETILATTSTGTTLSGLYGATGNIDSDTGVVSLDFSTSSGTVASGTNITVDYSYFPGLPVVGIWNFYQNDGTSQLVAMNTQRLNVYNELTSRFNDVTGSGIWTGDESNFVWATNYNNKMYMTNNLDRVQVYDGTTVEPLMIDITTTSGAINYVNTCLLIQAYKERLLLFRTDEVTDGDQPQRVRWCAVNNPEDWNEVDSGHGGYVDADTEEWIMGCDFIGDSIIGLFERSVWKLEYTGNSDSPFGWAKATQGDGCYATFSPTSYDNEITAQGPTGIISTDGRSTTRIDDKIPDLTLTYNPEKINMSYSVTIDELRQTWQTYVSGDSEHSDKVLVLNYNENSWSIYDLAINCFGFYTIQDDWTWNDLDMPWTQFEWTWADKTKRAGYPTTLGGDINGNIWQLNDTGGDNGEYIEAILEYGRWNPFIDQGLKARFGYLDILAENDPTITLTVDFYIDSETTPYKTETISLEATSDNEYVRKRLTVNSVGKFHKIRISHDGYGSFKILAIVPYFKPAGRII